MDISDRARIVAHGIRMRIRRLTGRHALASRLFTDGAGRLTPDAAAFLAQLGRSCFADTTTFDADARVHARNEGRREVYLEIMSGLELDGAKLAALTRQMQETNDE